MQLSQQLRREELDLTSDVEERRCKYILDVQNLAKQNLDNHTRHRQRQKRSHAISNWPQSLEHRLPFLLLPDNKSNRVEGNQDHRPEKNCPQIIGVVDVTRGNAKQGRQIDIVERYNFMRIPELPGQVEIPSWSSDICT